MESTRDGIKKRKDLEKKARESACEEFLSCMFIHCSDEDRYGQLKKDQHNPYLVGKSIYTDTLVDAKKLLEEWKGSGKKSAPPQQQPANKPGVGFVQAGTAGKEKKKSAKT